MDSARVGPRSSATTSIPAVRTSSTSGPASSRGAPCICGRATLTLRSMGMNSLRELGQSLTPKRENSGGSSRRNAHTIY
jgi:hypothetical protein